MSKYRNNRGIALPIVLIIILILTLLGTALWQYSVQDTIYAEINEKRMQAYYLARSGADAIAQYIIDNPDGIEDMKQYVDQLVAAPQSEPTYISDEVNGYFQVELSRDEENGLIIIESVGTVDEISRKVTLTLHETDDDSGWDELPLDMAVFSNTGLELSGDAQIQGNIGTNSNIPGSIKLDGGAGINGYVFIGPGGDAEEFSNQSGTDNRIDSDKIRILDEEQIYELPPFPEFPETLPWRGSFTAGWNPHPSKHKYEIDQDGEYDKITVLSELFINIGDEDRIIKVNTLDLRGSGYIALEKTGEGKLFLYIEETFKIKNSCAINQNGDASEVYVYYKGDSTVNFPGDIEFSGCLYAEKADIEIVDGSHIKGHIITGGEKVTLSGGTKTYVKALYAPYAVVNAIGGAKLRGSIVCDRFYGSGGIEIEYNDSIKETFPEFWNGGDEDGVVYKKGIWK